MRIALARAQQVAVDTIRRDGAAAAVAQRRLKTNPTDPAASLIAGRYVCADLQNWHDGLPLLANSSDAQVKKAAQLDISGAVHPI